MSLWIDCVKLSVLGLIASNEDGVCLFVFVFDCFCFNVLNCVSTISNYTWHQMVHYFYVINRSCSRKSSNINNIDKYDISENIRSSGSNP